jgi:murein DD-endopeptidase MepM/ murein hydrolase activator NlpD
MFGFKLLDGRCPAPVAALLAGIAIACAAAPAAADLASPAAHRAAAADTDTDTAEPGPLALVHALRARLEAVPDALPGLGWEPSGVQQPMHLWLSQAWPLGLAIRPAPAAVLTLWLTGSVRQVLGWIDPSPPRGHDTLDEILASLMIEPVSGAETSSYGYRRDPFTRRRKLHKGVDYRAPRGTPVFAAGPGVIHVASRKSGYGRVVMIRHGEGVETRYAHLQSIDVEAGERVPAGARIGTVGSTGRATGPHLHFELRIDGEAHDPQQVLGPLMPIELLALGR